MGRFLGITGTPGTGKKTLAPKVARALGLPAVGLNELLTTRERAIASRGVDPSRLRRRLLKRAKGSHVVYGHMVPDVLEKRETQRVVVLRCDPSELGRRLTSRGYLAAKVVGNVEAELIGVVSAACIAKFGKDKVAELDTTASSVAKSVEEVQGLLTGARKPGAPIDWVPLYSSAEKLRLLLSDARTTPLSREPGSAPS